MQRHYISRGGALLLCALLFFPFNPNVCTADSQLSTLESIQKKLLNIKKQTTTLTNKLRKKSEQKADIQSELRDTEKKISTLSKTILLLKTELQQSHTRIYSLNSKIQKLTKKTTQIKTNLKTTINKAYRDGSNNNFKLLF